MFIPTTTACNIKTYQAKFSSVNEMKKNLIFHGTTRNFVYLLFSMFQNFFKEFQILSQYFQMFRN